MKTIENIAKGLGGILIPLIPVLPVLVLCLIGWNFYKRKIRKNDEEELEQRKQAEGEQKKKEEKLERETSNILPSYPASVYLTMANTIYDCCDHYFYEDDIAFANELRKCKNVRDWSELYSAFGVRKIKGMIWDSDEMDLVGFINRYLDYSARVALQVYMVANGINIPDLKLI